MGISTKKGDSGYTSLLRGARVPKHHLIIEAGGSLDEANSQLFIYDRRILRGLHAPPFKMPVKFLASD
jgi:cob(I)alamin adenosyltransferase